MSSSKSKSQYKGATRPRLKVDNAVLFSIAALFAFAVMLVVVTRNNNNAPYFDSLNAVAHGLAHTSEHGCVTWTGNWSYTDDQFSGTEYHTVQKTIAGCSQVLSIDQIVISRKITRENSFYAIFRKEWDTIPVWDYLLTKGLPIQPSSDELNNLADGLAMLHLSVADQQEIVVTYSGPVFQWDAHSLPGCKEIQAVDQMSRAGQINGGGIPRLVAAACSG